MMRHCIDVHNKNVSISLYVQHDPGSKYSVASARVSKWYTFKCYQESLQTMIIVADMSHTHDENITGGGV